jgi:hypothetical protein
MFNKYTYTIFLLFFIQFVYAQTISIKGDKNTNIAYEQEIIEHILSDYPELDQSNITFVYKNIPTSGAARPAFFSWLKKYPKRSYKILLNSKCSHNKPNCYSQLSDTLKKGLLSHELCHIVDYNQLSTSELIAFGIKYIFSPKYKSVTEHKIDSMAIMHGYGIELYKFTSFILNHPNTKKSYKRKKIKFYMSPSEIETMQNVYFKQ